MSQDQLYTTLNLSRDCSASDIKRQFRRLSMMYHPDRLVMFSPQERRQHEAHYKQIVCAYEILSNPDMKREYDEYNSPADKTFDELKGGFKHKVDFDLQSYKQKHTEEIDARHKPLLDSFRERSAQEFKRTIENPRHVQKDFRRSILVNDPRVTTEITQVPEPVLAISQNRICHQQINRLGEMYYAGDPDRTLDDYSLAISRDIEERASRAETMSASFVERLRSERALRSVRYQV